jgi:hypothetical protein
MTPYFCEPGCPKIHNCGFMSKDTEIKNMVDEAFKDKKCPCAECIIIMKCGPQTGRESICAARGKIFEKIEYEICIISRKEIDKIRKQNDFFHKRPSSLE